MDDEADYEVVDWSGVTDFTALYMPSLSKGEEDPSRGGFPTEDAAWDFVFSGMCSGCLEERGRALALTAEQYETSRDSKCPPCACEWQVLPTEDLQDCDTPEDVLKAAGWKVVYRAEGEPEG